MWCRTVETLVAEILAELLARCRRGEQEAVARLVGQFAPPAADLARAILHDRHLAEDAVQAAFMTALARLDQLRQPEAFAAWLRQIVRTQAHRILRTRHDRPAERITDGPAPDATPDERLQQCEVRALVRRALAQVSPIGRQAAELYYFEQRSQAQIAHLLNVPEGTVKRRLHDARAQLRDILLGYFAEPPPAGPAAPPDEWPDT